MSLHIRPARSDDAEAVSELIFGLLHRIVPNPVAPGIGHFIETLTPKAVADRIAAPNFDCHLALPDTADGAAPIGFIAVRDGNHLHHLFVAADWHGRGIARALWNTARRQTRATRFTVNAAPAAVPVYRRFGFRPCASEQYENGLAFVPMVAFSNDPAAPG